MQRAIAGKDRGNCTASRLGTDLNGNRDRHGPGHTPYVCAADVALCLVFEKAERHEVAMLCDAGRMTTVTAIRSSAQRSQRSSGTYRLHRRELPFFL